MHVRRFKCVATIASPHLKRRMRNTVRASPHSRRHIRTTLCIKRPLSERALFVTAYFVMIWLLLGAHVILVHGDLGNGVGVRLDNQVRKLALELRR